VLCTNLCCLVADLASSDGEHQRSEEGPQEEVHTGMEVDCKKGVVCVQSLVLALALVRRSSTVLEEAEESEKQ